MPPATYIYDQRTRVLVDPNRYLTTTETRTITGYPAPTLARMVDEGRLIARRVGRKSLVFQTASVVAYCQQNSAQVSLFDLLATADGETITEEELANALDHTRVGTWWTLARRDQSPPDWPTWQNWYRGDTAQAQAALAAQRPRWAQQVKEHRARGLVRRTLWLPTQPLGGFGEYCLARYEHVAAAGGSVHVLPAWKLAHLENRRVIPDLEVTPDAVYVRRHTRVGSRDGAVRVTDPDLVTTTAAFLGWADRQHAISLGDFARWFHRGAA
ncbi:DUF6879 family protein [Nocardiopsis terrae]|uniref:DUF6879 family protein n=1 Tax=Streptomyces sp. NPDC057554 TaxID=3350538 RepID=UPI00368FB11C